MKNSYLETETNEKVTRVVFSFIDSVTVWQMFMRKAHSFFKSRAEPTFFGLRRRPWSAWGSWWRFCSRERTSWPNSACTELSWDQTSAVTKLSYFSVYCRVYCIESKVKFFSSFFSIEFFCSNEEKMINTYFQKKLTLNSECIWVIKWNSR